MSGAVTYDGGGRCHIIDEHARMQYQRELVPVPLTWPSSSTAFRAVMGRLLQGPRGLRLARVRGAPPRSDRAGYGRALTGLL